MSLSIYVPTCSEGFEWCLPLDSRDFEVIASQINGESRAATWRPVEVRLLRQDNGKELLRSDSPWLGAHALIFREEAALRLNAMLALHGELLSLACREARLLIFNPTQLIDALDEEASTVLRLRSGQIFQIKTYAFRPDVIGKLDIFKIPNLRSSPTFCSNRIVEMWKEQGLQGLDFTRVWPRPDTH